MMLGNPKTNSDVKFNLELKERHNRLYPDIKVGDKVKIYKKRVNLIRTCSSLDCILYIQLKR
jgi:hypothetical protein